MNSLKHISERILLRDTKTPFVNSESRRRPEETPVSTLFRNQGWQKGIKSAVALVIRGFGLLPQRVILGNGKGNIRESARFCWGLMESGITREKVTA